MPSLQHIKFCPFALEDADEGRFEIAGMASTNALDRDREVIEPAFWPAAIPGYLQNGIITWQHDFETPIGVALTAEARSHGVFLHARISQATEKSRNAWALIADKVVKTFSVGFAGSYDKDHGFYSKDEDAWHWTSGEWWETGVVTIPSNREAIFDRVKAGGGTIGSYHGEGATSFGDLPLADAGVAWNGPGAAKRVMEWAGGSDDLNWSKYRKAFAWYDANAMQKRESYKLPFADVIDDQLVAVWRGVAAAMGALLGARQEVDIPEEDRKAAYNHMARYYEKFGKKTPEFKGAWPDNYRAVTWHNDEPAIYEEANVRECLQTAKSRLVGVANMTAHWRKEGGVPSLSVVDAFVDAASAIAESAASVIQMGRGLGDENAAKLGKALTAIGGVMPGQAPPKAPSTSPKPVVRVRL